MKSLSQSSRLTVFLAAMFLVDPALLKAAKPNTPSATLMILVYNYARLPERGLDRAESEANRVFQQAGLKTVWVGCPVTAVEASGLSSCPKEANPRDLVLKIIPQFNAKREGFSDSLFGFAAGFQVSVISERVEDIARASDCLPSKILGLMIAHEIGHALLGPHSHSPHGIMRPLWGENDFRMATRLSLRFENEQVARIRLSLSIRAVSGE